MLLSVRRWAVGSVIALNLAAPAAAAAARQAPAAGAAALYEQGERALAAGRYAEAERSYERLRTLEPDRAEVHARLGLIYFQQGKFADTLPVLRRALELKPGLPNVDALLAMSLSEIG